MSIRQAKLEEVARSDGRYAYEAYEFVLLALNHTLQRCGKPAADAQTPTHISGREWAEGIRDLALREFGLLARIVFKLWGVQRTDDFGDIVFQLVDANLISKSAEDRREDFQNVYDFEDALVGSFRIELDEVEQV